MYRELSITDRMIAFRKAQLELELLHLFFELLPVVIGVISLGLSHDEL